MSDALPLRGWLYDLIPPTRYFRHSSMLRGYSLFLLSVLALFGAKDLASWPKALRNLTLLAPGLAVASGAVFAFVITGAASEHPQPALAIAHIAILQGGLIALAMALRRSLTSTVQFLPALLISFALFDGLAAMHFTDGTLVNRGPRPKFPVASDTSVALGPERFARAMGSARVNANLIFKIPTLKNYTPFRNRFHELITGDPALQVHGVG